MLTEWLGIKVSAQGQVEAVATLDEVMQRTGLQQVQPNNGRELPIAHIQAALPQVIAAAQAHLKPIKAKLDTTAQHRVDFELSKLGGLKQKYIQQLQLDFTDPSQATQRQKQKSSEVVDLFTQYQNWIYETLKLDDRAQITVVTVLTA